MIAIKGGTQAFSRNPAEFKPDNVQTLSATEKDKALGGKEDIGELLNKVADPNWVDPKKTRHVGNADLDKDSFMKLFLAQLKNQDPTNTMDPHAMAAELAQFTQLEKLNSINEGIGNLAKSTGSQGQYEILSLVGKTITGDSSKVIRTDVKDAHDVTFKLGGDADIVEFSIKNANGQEIRKLEAHGLKAGANKIVWDGHLENGNPAEVGEYNITLMAKSGSGQKLAAETKFEGTVSGIQFTGQGPVLKVGNTTVRMADVKGIVDPALAMAAANAQKASETRSLKAADPNAVTVAGMGGNLESVGMQQGMIDKIDKEVNKNLNSNPANNTREGVVK